MSNDEKLLQDVWALAAAGHQESMIDHFHPDVVVVPYLSPGRVLGHGDFLAYVGEQTAGASMREARADHIDRVADGRFVVTGRVRWSRPGGGFFDSPAAWAVVVRDGAIYRLKAVASREDAVRVLDEDDWSPLVDSNV